MGVLMNTDRKSTLGPWVRNLRIYLKLTQKEIARLAKVTPEEVNLLENNKPLSFDIKNRILKELNNIRIHNWDILVNC